MPVFSGTIRLEDGDGLETNLTVDDGRLLVTAGEHEIGNWAIAELSAVRRDGEFRLNVEDDELVVGVADPTGLSQALGIKDGPTRQRRVKKPKAAKRLKRKERSQPEAVPPAETTIADPPLAPVEPSPAPDAPSVDQSGQDELSWWARLTPRTKLIGAGVVALVILGVVSPNLLALLLMIAGLATLFLAIAATSESGTFMPPPFFATPPASFAGIALVIVGIVIMVIA